MRSSASPAAVWRAVSRSPAGTQEYIERELGHLPAETRHKIVCVNAAKLYRFVN